MTLQVSWIRHRDVHLLTIGQYTYTNDQRFKPIHVEQSEDWTLEIKYAQLRDSGCYECQISTTPHISHIVYLDVIGVEIPKHQRWNQESVNRVSAYRAFPLSQVQTSARYFCTVQYRSEQKLLGGNRGLIDHTARDLAYPA
ncbi:hypothetical protein WN48_07067 [Eufriesea mexicana]|uniref:Ig-like domain-containing protein n=1 Tax=Eufriesea mexicana TaxID=516756 RepID=A0A310SVN2_9HYME|nr:hypothetical protein WN48_07067 [Eufriesea mexicana]